MSHVSRSRLAFLYSLPTLTFPRALSSNWLVSIDKLSKSFFEQTEILFSTFVRGTWNILLSSKEEAERLLKKNIVTKFYQIQPEYLGTRWTKVTVFNTPVELSGSVPFSCLIPYGRIEVMNPPPSLQRNLYLKREGFAAILDTITFRKQRLTEVVKGRQSHCLVFKLQDHLSEAGPKKTSSSKPKQRLTRRQQKRVKEEERDGPRVWKGDEKLP